MRYRKSITSVGFVTALALLFGACSGGSSGSAAVASPSGAAAATGSGIPQTTSAYGDLPFTDILPMAEGEIKIDGKAPKLVIGFSQTCFNHPWRVAMLASVKAEVDRHPNVSLVTLDGNCDIAKQSNDIDDLIARG